MELATVIGAFDVDRPAKPALQIARETRDLDDLTVAQGRPSSEKSWDVDLPRTVRDRDRHDALPANRVREWSQIGLSNHVGVRRHGPADDALSQAPAGIDHDLVAIARHRIGTEHYRRNLGGNEPLNEDRDANSR